MLLHVYASALQTVAADSTASQNSSEGELTRHLVLSVLVRFFAGASLPSVACVTRTTWPT